MSEGCDENESSATRTVPGAPAGAIVRTVSRDIHPARTGAIVPNLTPTAVPSPSTKPEPRTRTTSPPRVEPTGVASVRTIPSACSSARSDTVPSTAYSTAGDCSVDDCSSASVPAAIAAAPGARGGSSHSINAEDTTCADALVADPCPAPTTHRDRSGSKFAPTNATNRCDPVVDAPRGDAERADPNLPTPELPKDPNTVRWTPPIAPLASSTATPAYACDAVPYDAAPDPGPGARRSAATDPGVPAGDTHVAVATLASPLEAPRLPSPSSSPAPAPAPGSTAAATDVVPNRHEWRDPKPPKPKPNPPFQRAATIAPPRHAPAVPFHLNSPTGDRHDANALDASADESRSSNAASILSTATRCTPGSSSGVSHVTSAVETNLDVNPKTSDVTFPRASVANQVHADAGANPPPPARGASAVACVRTPPPASAPVGRMDATRPGTTYSKTSVSLPP